MVGDAAAKASNVGCTHTNFQAFHYATMGMQTHLCRPVVSQNLCSSPYQTPFQNIGNQHTHTHIHTHTHTHTTHTIAQMQVVYFNARSKQSVCPPTPTYFKQSACPPTPISIKAPVLQHLFQTKCLSSNTYLFQCAQQTKRLSSNTNVSLRRGLAVSPWELREALDAMGRVGYTLWVGHNRIYTPYMSYTLCWPQPCIYTVNDCILYYSCQKYRIYTIYMVLANPSCMEVGDAWWCV